MKKLAILFLLAAMAAGVSCTKEQGKPEGGKKLKILSSELVYQPAGGQGTIEVSSPSPVTAISEKAWCQVSVSGQTVNISITEPNESRMSRYSLVTLTSGNEKAYLSVQQYGMVVSEVDFLGLDVKAASGTAQYPLTTNLPVTVTSTAPWLSGSWESNVLTVNIEENTSHETRLGTLTVIIDKNYLLEVKQEPVRSKEEDWKIEEGDIRVIGSDKEFDFKFSGITTKYYCGLVPADDVTGDVDDWLFSTLDEQVRDSEAALSEGDITITEKNVTKGSYYVVALGYGENGYPNGYYQYEYMQVGYIPYEKWLGKWNAKISNGSTTVWEIETKEENVSYTVKGISGLKPSGYPDDFMVAIANFNPEDNTLQFKVQQNDDITYKDASRGDVHPMLSGQYTNVAGKTYYNSGVGTVICHLELSADGLSALIVPHSVTSGGAPATFHNMRWYGRYLSGSSWSAFSWNANYDTPLPQTITRTN